MSRLLCEDVISSQQERHLKTGTDLPLEYGLVLYTDGGCKGVSAGYGIHGYIYATTPMKAGAGIPGYIPTDYGYILKDSSSPVEVVNLANSATERRQPQQITPINYVDIEGSILEGTNNIAEATAFIKSLEFIEKILPEVELKRVHFRIDSKYVLNYVINRASLVSNNWVNRSGTHIPNKELWVELISKLTDLECTGISWSVEWVKGHMDFFGNVRADDLATRARVAAQNNYEYSTTSVLAAKGRWKVGGVDISSNPALAMLLESYWFWEESLYAVTRDDGLKPIYTGSHDELDNIGALNSDKVCSSVVLMKDPPPQTSVLVDIARQLDNMDNGYDVGGAFVGDMRNIINPDIAKLLIEHGDKFVIKDLNGKRAYNYNDKEIATRLHPPRLAMVYTETLSELHYVIDRVATNRLLPEEVLTDVTDEFYIRTKTNKGKESIKVTPQELGAKRVTVGVNVLNTNNVYEVVNSLVTLSYGTTAPRHRIIGALKDYGAKILVLTRYLPTAGFKFYTVITLPSGECGIWTNVSANYQQLKSG